MAEEASQGKKSLILQSPFDPRTFTLQQFINQYVAEGRAEGRELKNWGADFANTPELKPYLNRPVIDITSSEFFEGEDSPLRQLNRNTSKGKLDKIKPKFRAIFKSVNKNLLTLPQAEREALPEVRDLRDSIIKELPKATGEAVDVEVKKPDFKYKLNPLKLGEFYIAAMEHVRLNPEDAPMVRAFLFNLQSGMRPDEVVNLTDANVYKPRLAQEYIERARQTSQTWVADLLDAAGGRPFMTGYIPKTKTLVDAPLSDHSLAIIGAQQAYNSELEAKYGKGNLFLLRSGDMVLGRTIFMKDTDKGPKPVTPSDITNVIRKIKVPGIVEEIREDGTSIPRDTFQLSYDARRMNATAHKLIGTPINIAAQLKGRAVTETGGGREGDYRRLIFGVYPNESISAQNRLSELMLGLVETEYRAEQNQGMPTFGKQVFPGYVPGALSYNDDYQPLLPTAEDKPPAVTLLDPSVGDSKFLNGGTQAQLNASTTPDITVIADDDYVEAYNTASLGKETPDATKPKVEMPKVATAEQKEDLKTRLQDRLNAVRQGFKGTNLKGVAAPLTLVTGAAVSSYSEGSQTVEEAGGGELAQKIGGAGQVLWDLFEGPRAMAARMTLGSAEVNPYTEADYRSPTYGPIETPTTRGQAVQYNTKINEAALAAQNTAMSREMRIFEQKKRIEEYDAYMANQNRSVDDQMNELTGVQPDIEVTYPNTPETTQ